MEERGFPLGTVIEHGQARVFGNIYPLSPRSTKTYYIYVAVVSILSVSDIIVSTTTVKQ